MNRANCAAIAILGAITANAEVITNDLYDAVSTDVKVGYKITGLNDGKEEVVVFTKDSYDITWNVPANLENIEYLIVGGGGGGGTSYASGTKGAGGGGAGGFENSIITKISAGSEVLIKVGAKGVGGANGVSATSGSPSEIVIGENEYSVYGGGAGGSHGNAGTKGGSGGGGSGASKAGGSVYNSEEGYKGGTSLTNYAGGGGGAGGAGENGVSGQAGKGGPGKICEITGEPIYYAAGGGGGGAIAGVGGIGGGGAGGVTGKKGSAATGYGCGGGGGTYQWAAGGAGYQGIVVLRYAIPAEVVAKIGEAEYASISDAVSAANEGDTIKVIAEVNVDAAINVAKKVTIDLNGQTVRATEKDTVGDGVFCVVAGGDLTINDSVGTGVVNGVGGNPYNMAIWANGGKVTINGGTYTNVGAQDDGPDGAHFDLIYAKNGGSVEINGGYFKCETPNFTLNCHDASYKAGNTSIVVKGGTFYKFNPSNNTAEGACTDFCADGYAGLSNPDDEFVVGVMPTATVSNLGSITVGLGDYTANAYMMYDIINGGKLQEATVPYDLTLAMDFKAKDTAETAAQNAFGNYTTDFFITMSGMSQASFVGDGCYLAGYYPSFKAWVKIPLDGFTVENGKVYPVITSAGFDFKYTDICGTVGQFICGIYLTPEVLAANPNLTVDLTLGLAENKDAALNAQFLKVDNYVYDVDDLVTLPEVVITDIKNTLTDADPDLTFALNFAIKDVDKLSEEYLEKLFAKYGDYYTDYVLTISGLTDPNGSVKFNANGNGNGYLAGQYDAWSTNWVTVPFSDVTVTNGQSFYIMEYAAELMNKGGLRLTLKEIAEIVKNFDCGVYFTPEFLAANPNLKVELELKVFTEDENGNKVGDISVATNTFDKDDFSVEAAKLDIRIVNGKPQIGFAGEGKLVLNAATALTGEWTKNISYTVVENDGDDTKTWVTPAEGCYFFKGFITK